MNINTFGNNLEGLGWIVRDLQFLDGKRTFILPYERFYRELSAMKNAEVLDLGGSDHWIVRKKPHSTSLWWAAIKTHIEDWGQDRYYPLVLEWKWKHTKEVPWGLVLLTPPGRPGSPTTILADSKGEIVPELYCPKGSRIQLFFLSRDWKNFHWTKWGGLYRPVVALQVMDGICEASKAKRVAWDENLMRNRM